MTPAPRRSAGKCAPLPVARACRLVSSGTTLLGAAACGGARKPIGRAPLSTAATPAAPAAHAIAAASREAALQLATLPLAARNAALEAVVSTLEARKSAILEANAADMTAAAEMVASGELSSANHKRLELTEGKWVSAHTREASRWGAGGGRNSQPGRLPAPCHLAGGADGRAARTDRDGWCAALSAAIGLSTQTFGLGSVDAMWRVLCRGNQTQQTENTRRQTPSAASATPWSSTTGWSSTGSRARSGW